MASNMTKAFQAKAKRSLGCRPGYDVGGMTDVFKTGSNSFSDQPGVGSTVMQPGVGQQGMLSTTPTATPSPAAAPLGGGMNPNRGAPIYGAGPKETGFTWNDGTRRDGLSPEQGRMQDAKASAVAAAPVAAEPGTWAEKMRAQGHDPRGMYQYDQSGNPVFLAEQNRRPQNKLGSGNLWGYADGGKVDPPTRAPRDDYEVPKTFMGHVQKIGGLVGRMVDEIRNPVQSAPDQSSPLDVREQIVKRHVENAQARDAYADGGAVRQVEFQGPGGPREDKIPVRFAGADIRVSDGERGLILPAKTAANPQAVDAIEDIIQGTNDGRSPRRGLGDGGHYAPGSLPVPNLDLIPKDAIPYTREIVGAAPQAPDLQIQTPRDLSLDRMRAGQSHITQSMGDAARLNGAGQSAEFAPPQPPARPAAQPQNIAPELRMPADPAPVAEPQVRRGLLGRGVDALKGGAQNVAGKVLGMEPKVQTAEAATPAPTAKPVEKSPTPITDRAQALGKALGKGEIPGVMKTDTQGNKYLTKGAGAAAGIGTALQAGDHWDAYGDRPGGLTHGERAQLFARDMGVLAGGTAGAVGGGVAGSFVTPIVGTGVGGVAGAVIGGTLADKGMGKLRESANWVNEKLGGAPNYFEDSDAMIARDRAAREAQGIPESAPQRTARAVNSTIGSALQGASNFIGGTSAGGSSWGGEGRTPTLVDQGTTESPSGGAQAQAAPAPAPVAAPTAPQSTGFLKVTGEGGPNMSSGVKRRGIGFTMTPGNMSPNQYVGADGTPNQVWEKTSAYADAQRRAQQNRIDLQQVQDERRGTSTMASRALGQQMQAPGANAATDASSSDALMQSALANLNSPDPGTRALGHQQMVAQNQMIQQQMALAKARREALDKQTEQGIAGNDAVIRKEKELRDKMASAFQKPDPEGKKGSIPDEDKVADYISNVSSTMRHAGEEAKGDEKHKWVNGVTKKSRSPGELDDADHDRMRRWYEIGERVRSMAGSMPWKGENITTDDLRDWEPTQLPSGGFEFKRLSAKTGRPIVVPASYLKYAQGAQGSYMPSWGKTDTNRYTQNTQGAN
jgi:hypothetical protein